MGGRNTCIMTYDEGEKGKGTLDLTLAGDWPVALTHLKKKKSNRIKRERTT